MGVNERPARFYSEFMTGAWIKFTLPQETFAVTIQMRNVDTDLLISYLEDGSIYFTLQGWATKNGIKDSQLTFRSPYSMEGGVFYLYADAQAQATCEIICYRR